MESPGDELPLPAAAAPGTLLGGRYRVEGLLGRGGMGVVLAATHVELDKPVAVKLLVSARPGSDVERFRREAKLAANIESAHVARVLDFGTHDGLPFLVMERLHGRDLEAELEARGRIPVPESIELVLSAAVGLAHAHAQGLVHRDVKPANLFLAQSAGGRRVVKVLDFGLSKAPSTGPTNLTTSGEVFGTPQYMAPEQIESTRNADARCDQHALALVLFELIAGRPTFVGESVPQVIVAIATRAAPPLRTFAPHAPPQLEAIVARALAKRPDDRFPDLAAFAEAIASQGASGAEAQAQEIAAVLRGHGGAAVVHTTAPTRSRHGAAATYAAVPAVVHTTAPARSRPPSSVAARLAIGAGVGAAVVAVGAAVLWRVLAPAQLATPLVAASAAPSATEVASARPAEPIVTVAAPPLPSATPAGAASESPPAPIGSPAAASAPVPSAWPGKVRPRTPTQGNRPRCDGLDCYQ